MFQMASESLLNFVESYAGNGEEVAVRQQRGYRMESWTYSEIAAQANCVARGRSDPGHVVLEAVLVVSAGITIVAFVIWFFFIAGASPVPGLQVNF